MASPGLRQDYEGCVNLYQDYIAQHAPAQCEYNVSQVGSSKKDGGGKCRGGGGVSFSDKALTGIKVDDRYYTPKEYASLDPKQKVKLKTVRHERGHKPSKKKKRGGSQNNDKLDKLGHQVSSSSLHSQERKEKTLKAIPMTQTTSQARSPTTRTLPSPINVARNDP